MAPSRELSPVSHPSFIVIKGSVHMQMSGNRYDVLEKGESVSFERHGKFLVEYTADTYGILQHTTRSGRVLPVFIPPKKGALISNGIWNFYEVNYQSYLDSLSHSYLHVSIHGRRCGKLRDSDPMAGPPIGPFCNDHERESWKKRFEGQFHAMQARNGSTLSVGELYVVCEPTTYIQQLPPHLRSSQKPTPENYVHWLESEMYPFRTLTEHHIDGAIRQDREARQRAAAALERNR